MTTALIALLRPIVALVGKHHADGALAPKIRDVRHLILTLRRRHRFRPGELVVDVHSFSLAMQHIGKREHIRDIVVEPSQPPQSAIR
ncbi:hypothetical protein ACFOKI_06590 [Sphingomonas qilianensis]|uniref:Uncharacterized protein n=1 Tax=Sphingomonas qilianensis TaxID=1736690 RepID=A0ABU9XR29_9SPHN